MANQQQELNKLLGECRIEKIHEHIASFPPDEILELKPCGYHKNRSLNSAYAIDGNIVAIQQTPPNTIKKGIIHRTSKARQFASKFRKKSKHPAGGWYLVQEQREWLEEELFNLLKQKKNGSTVYILEAGVASYVHHYTYISIIKKILSKLKDEEKIELKIEIYVLEKCCYPLYQIKAVETVCRWDKEDYLYPNPDEAFIDFLERESIFEEYNSKRISVKLVQYDFLIEYEKSDLKRNFTFKFDIITEHFLTSVVRNMNDVKKIRYKYAQSLLKENGSLLCASGIEVSRVAEYEEYMLMHTNLNFKLFSSQDVWDPYGLEISEILKIADNVSDIEVAFDNTMFHFIRT